MHEAEHRTFAQPDEVREFPHGRAEIVKIGNGEVGRYTFETGMALVKRRKAHRQDTEL
jgi:hypothetical protein